MKICTQVGTGWARVGLAGALVLGCAGAVLAQAPAPTPEEAARKQDSATMDFFRRTEISGFADMYYGYNFNTPRNSCATAGGVPVFNCLRSFDVAHNAFSLALAEVAFDKKPTSDSRGGFRLDLDYGSTAAIVAGGEAGIYQNIQQAYVSYLANAGGGLQLDFGKFVTPLGFEVIESKDNWNYSRSLLFQLAIPLYHAGMKASYAINDQVSVAGYLVNGWNNAVENNTGKSVIAQILIKPSADLMLVTNYFGGPEKADTNSDWRHASDTTVTYAINNEVSVAGNFDYFNERFGDTSAKLWGIAAYLRYQPMDWFALTPRIEYLDDNDGFATGATQKLKDFTLTFDFKHKDGFLMRAEYRGDFSDVPYFFKNATELKKNQNSVTFGFVYAFTTKAQ